MLRARTRQKGRPFRLASKVLLFDGSSRSKIYFIKKIAGARAPGRLASKIHSRSLRAALSRLPHYLLRSPPARRPRPREGEAWWKRHAHSPAPLPVTKMTSLCGAKRTTTLLIGLWPLLWDCVLKETLCLCVYHWGELDWLAGRGNIEATGMLNEAMIPHWGYH